MPRKIGWARRLKVIRWAMQSNPDSLPRQSDESWEHVEKSIRSLLGKNGDSIDLQNHVVNRLKPLWAEVVASYDVLKPEVGGECNVTMIVNQVCRQVGDQAYDRMERLLDRIVGLEADLYRVLDSIPGKSVDYQGKGTIRIVPPKGSTPTVIYWPVKFSGVKLVLRLPTPGAREEIDHLVATGDPAEPEEIRRLRAELKVYVLEVGGLTIDGQPATTEGALKWPEGLVYDVLGKVDSLIEQKPGNEPKPGNPGVS